ncbi:hypothetical protein [Fibrobacter sp. UWH1]|uniref:hypothetical protein n=1 Tax=Fibrobacter sp. UWH1 TaxID=1964354 RepID=UPI000B52058B|nr:hypothetical protein [Fibrobacter sp. UWH1]OWV14718.1 hypothetical protein B7992_07190 [Fibrobacter sp. UWH1]
MNLSKLIKLSNKYSKADHDCVIPYVENLFWEKFKCISNPAWRTQTDSPYEILTYMVDAYSLLPARPDLASLFCWQAINHSYNDLQIKKYVGNRKINAILQDDVGIDFVRVLLLTNIDKYYNPLHMYVCRLHEKVYRFVASYLLEGYLCKNNENMYEVFVNRSCKKMSNIVCIKKLVENVYGPAYNGIAAPYVSTFSFHKGITDSKKARHIINSFAKSIQTLMNYHSLEMDDKNTGRKVTYELNNEDEMKILLNGIIYASRCTNFHGGVSSRLNTIYANNESYMEYMNVFLTEYEILAIILHSQCMITDDVLLNVHQNLNLMFTK